MPMPVRPSPKNNPKPDKRPAADAPERPNKYQKGKGKGKNKGKAKSKQGTIDIPQGCVAKTPDGKPLCFAFNKGVCGFRGSGPRCQRGYHLCYKQGCHKPKPYHECSHVTNPPLRGGSNTIIKASAECSFTTASSTSDASVTSAAFCNRNLLWPSLFVQRVDQCRFFSSCSGPCYARSPSAGHPLGFDPRRSSEHLN